MSCVHEGNQALGKNTWWRMRKRQRGELDRNKNRKVRGRKTGQDRHDRTNCGCPSADTNHLCVGVSVHLCVCVLA